VKRLISRYNFHVKQSANLTCKRYRKLLSHLNNATKVALSVYETVTTGLIMASFGIVLVWQLGQCVCNDFA